MVPEGGGTGRCRRTKLSWLLLPRRARCPARLCRSGEPFRKLLNQNADIPGEASRVHGYTREILERDGEPPVQVYREFAEYAGTLPLVSFNLEYDLDGVLIPEWKRLKI